MSRYAVTVTECRFGWAAVAQFAPDAYMEMVCPPLFWRPTRDWALRAAMRRARSWARRERREQQAVVVPVEYP